MSENLDYKLRENKGRLKFEVFHNVFINSGFINADLKTISLQDSDFIIDDVKMIFSNIKSETELIDGGVTFTESDLMRHVYLGIEKSDSCYIYTDDFTYCGMFLTDGKKAFERALNVAKTDLQNTSFILDAKYHFHFTITYNDNGHNDSPDTFDIHRKLSK